MSETQQQSKKITVGLLLSWIFGSLFSLTGIISIFSEPIPGLVILVMAAVILPPVTKFVDKKWKFHLSTGMKIGIIVIGLIIITATIDTSDVSNPQQVNVKKDIIEKTVTNSMLADEQPVPEKNEKTNYIPMIGNEISKETVVTSTEGKTASQKNAILKAKSYLDYSAFSYTGLIKQLEYEKFSHVDAVYGADNSGADWNVQAAKKAQSYMEYSAFSRGGLIEQLQYDGFTQAQAEHGADSVGL